MRDEARNTSSHTSWDNKDARLRKIPITFVSAGLARPLDDLELSARSKEAISEVDTGDCGPEVSPSNGDVVSEIPDKMHERESYSASKFISSNNQGSRSNPGRRVPDTPGQNLSHPNVPLPAPGGDVSDSEEEVILFKGRKWLAAQKYLHRDNASRITPIDRDDVLKDDAHGQIATLSEAASDNRVSLDKSQVSRESRPAPTKENDDGFEGPEIHTIDAAAKTKVETEPTFGTISDLGIRHGAAGFVSSTDDAPMKEESEKYDNSDAIDEDEGLEEDSDGEFTRPTRGMAEDDGDMDADIDDEALARLFFPREEADIGANDPSAFSTPFSRSRDQEAFTEFSTRKPGNQYTTTQTVADAFDSLDLEELSLDRNTLSRSQRKKLPPIFGASDSELERAMQKAWLTDRERKKVRKLEREELRQQGLLGKTASPSDLRGKYPNGLGLDDIKLELQTFLMGSTERYVHVPFPL
jgi:hypothetical protein